MATKKVTMTRDKIVSMFMDYALENIDRPKTVYQFTKQNNFSETEFYRFFGTIESVEKEIFKIFIEKTIELLNKDKEYESYDMKSKMLSFYFTFFELLSANRSYVIMSLKNHQNDLKNLIKLSSMRTIFKNFVSETISDDYLTKQEKLQDFQRKTIQETSWIQLLFTMRFWLEDSSPSFEKTDIYIEKSVKATFELMNIAPIDSLIDFGKFIFKEKVYSK